MSKWVMFSSVLHSQRRRKYWSLWHGKQSGNYTGVLWKEVLFHNAKLEKRPRNTLCFLVAALNSTRLRSTLKRDVGFRAVFNFEHLWASVASLEVRMGKGEQEGIYKGFLLSMERKSKINAIWFPFAAREMLQGVEVGYHQPGVKLACLRSGACSCLARARGCAGLGNALTPPAVALLKLPMASA